MPNQMLCVHEWKKLNRKTIVCKNCGEKVEVERKIIKEMETKGELK